MKLSEAMRQGAKQYPQCFYTYFDWTESEQAITACCALGAVWIGSGLPIETTDMRLRVDVLMETYPELRHMVGSSHRQVFDEIVVRNDALRQTREAIADWLESIGL